MKNIESYLLDPNKSGVYITTVSIHLSTVIELLKEINAYKKRHKINRADHYKLLDVEERLAHMSVRTVVRRAMEDLENAVVSLDIEEPSKGVLSAKILSARSLSLFTTRDLGLREHLGRRGRGAYFPDAYLHPNVAILKTMDAISIKPSFHSPNLIIDVVSVKESGCKIFEKFIKSIPIICQKANVTHRGKRHSSRYCCEPYSAAVMLWSIAIADKFVPEDILNYFDSSVIYWEKNEWRISIVLSAIAVESLLAEIYEEYFHEVAPSEPLGALRDRIENKQKFPRKVRKDIEFVNQSRIYAVHRSSMQVGEREARNALMGATRFTQWAFSDGPLTT